MAKTEQAINDQITRRAMGMRLETYRYAVTTPSFERLGTVRAEERRRSLP